MRDLVDRCNEIYSMFKELESTNSRIEKEIIYDRFKEDKQDLVEDLDFCFEVLAGKHKLGYTYNKRLLESTEGLFYKDLDFVDEEYHTIKGFVNNVLKKLGSSAPDKLNAVYFTPSEIREFIEKLVNREFRLGYSNKDAQLTKISPMLAKKYPDDFTSKYYYVQEKLDGNRCIAYYDKDKSKWCFMSRSGKPMKVEFNMSWAPINTIFDGEVVTENSMKTTDFNKTSGAINGKYTDKSALIYYIYDIVATDLSYKNRLILLKEYERLGCSENVRILPVLSHIYLYPNVDYNWILDDMLDRVVNAGGEGVMLRDPDAFYEHKRSNGLLKYKKTNTMDLRVIGWNDGKGKYIGAIGSFICETDDKEITVSVAGMSDDVRFSDPKKWLDKIIEVAYFSVSTNSNGTKSLRFPRMVRLRTDKNETSKY